MKVSKAARAYVRDQGRAPGSMNELKEKYQIQLHDHTKLVAESQALKKENHKLNQQIKSLETKHEEALKLSYERAQDTEQNFAKQIDSWKTQAEKSQIALSTKEKEWEQNHKENLKKLEKLYQQLSALEEMVQNKNREIQHVNLTVDEKQKSILHFTQQIKLLNHSLTIKDEHIEEQQTEIDLLKEKLKSLVNVQ